jgi:hypothetical protein
MQVSSEHGFNSERSNSVTDISDTLENKRYAYGYPIDTNSSYCSCETAAVGGTGKVGDVITYTFAVNNTGNTTLTDVIVTDPMVGLITGNNCSNLVGASNGTIKGTYTIIKRISGKVVNTALLQKILGNECNGYLWNYRDKRYYGYPIDTNPRIALVKTAAVGGTGKVGDVITILLQ